MSGQIHHVCFGGFLACSALDQCPACRKVFAERILVPAIMAAGLNGQAAADVQKMVGFLRANGVDPVTQLGVSPDLVAVQPADQVQAFWRGMDLAMKRLHDVDMHQMIGQFEVVDVSQPVPVIVQPLARRAPPQPEAFFQAPVPFPAQPVYPGQVASQPYAPEMTYPIAPAADPAPLYGAAQVPSYGAIQTLSDPAPVIPPHAQVMGQVAFPRNANAAAPPYSASVTVNGPGPGAAGGAAPPVLRRAPITPQEIAMAGIPQAPDASPAPAPASSPKLPDTQASTNGVPQA